MSSLYLLVTGIVCPLFLVKSLIAPPSDYQLPPRTLSYSDFDGWWSRVRLLTLRGVCSTHLAAQPN